ncbi:MAG TPA: right-handed parallel beta-helix repeat-containing protein [Polyangiaceae bacterium]|nr:right-handed parallel beta-helix repeat-containing protein [Polyangiaceae bacterium]
MNSLGAPSLFAAAVAFTACLGSAPTFDFGAIDGGGDDGGGPPPPGIYVSQAGSDQHDGKSADAPMRTFDAAIRAAGAGGYVYLSGLYYDERIVINASGASGKPVTLRPDPAKPGVIDGAQSDPTGKWSKDDLVLIKGDNLVWDGIEIRNSPWNGLNIDGHDNTVRRTKIHDIYVQPLTSGGDNTLFEDNEITNGERCNVNNSDTQQIVGGGISSRFNNVKQRRSTNFTARRNKISNTWGVNMAAFHVDVFEISDNDVAPPTAVGISVDNASNGVVERNYIHDGKLNSLGFGSLNYPYATTTVPPHDITWRNNIVHDGGAIVFIRDGTKTYSNLHFIGNTFAGPTLHFDQANDGVPTGCEFVDNIFDGSDFTIYANDIGGWTIDHNEWHGTVAPQGTHQLTADPVGYVNSDSSAADGLKIKTDSPLAHAGIARPDLTTDYFGMTRSAPPSIGAHQP